MLGARGHECAGLCCHALLMTLILHCLTSFTSLALPLGPAFHLRVEMKQPVECLVCSQGNAAPEGSFALV